MAVSCAGLAPLDPALDARALPSAVGLLRRGLVLIMSLLVCPLTGAAWAQDSGRVTRILPAVPRAPVQSDPAATAQTPTTQPQAATAPVTSPAEPAPAAAPAAPEPAAAPATRVEAGLLECRGDMATAYGFGSNRAVACEFRSAAGGMNHYYSGTLSRVGLDFGVSDQASMIWMVLATTRQLGPGALAGDYVGFTSGAALGPGFSANVLMAKDAASGIALQPLSVSSDSGLSISFAAAGLTLHTTTAPKH